jgi:NADH dehydrogenase FAD-containing subunit
MFKTTMIAMGLTGLASTAWADAAAGDACAGNLTPDGKQIYAAVVAANPTLQNLRDTVEEQARSLVFAGKIARAEGRDNAFAAGECVRARLQ